MKADEARLSVVKAKQRKEAEAMAASAAQQKRIEEEQKYVEEAEYPRFLKDVHRGIKDRSGDAADWVDFGSTNKLIATLTVKRLREDGYQAHYKEHYIPEDRQYGDSGEGMHDAYWAYSIHVYWGNNRYQCPACNRDFGRY